MINPHKVTDFNRTDAELEEFLLFCVVAAGKTATTQARLLDAFLSDPTHYTHATPFEKIKSLILRGNLFYKVKHSGLGQYTRISQSFYELAMAEDFDLRTATIEELQHFTGIGPKTARFFILHTRPNQKYCVIDTHVLKFMREKGWTTIKSTPNNKTYAELEHKYLTHLDDEGVTDFAEYDLGIWKKYTKTIDASA